MAQGYLQMSYRNQSNSDVSVFRVFNGTTEQVGSSFGNVEDASATNDHVAYNRVCHWRNNLYARNQNVIWKYDVLNSGDWGVFHTITGASVQRTGLGFYLTNIGGEPAIYTGCGNGNLDDIIVAIIDKDGNVTEQTITNPDTGMEGVDVELGLKPINYRNQVVWGRTRGQNRSAIDIYDADANAITSIDSSNGEAGLSFAVWDDVLYCLELQTSTQFLNRVVGGTLIPIASFGEGATTSSDESSNGALLIDPTNNKAYCFFTQSAIGKDIGRCFEVEADGTFQDVSTTILPSEFREGGGLDNSSVTWRWNIKSDMSSTIGTPQIFIEVHTNAFAYTDAVAIYKWNGPNSAISFVSNGPSLQFSQVTLNNGTEGLYTWGGSGILSASAPRLTNGLLDIEVEFELFGPGVHETGVAVEMYFSPNGEYSTSQSTLYSPSAGSVSGNVITGLTADNGATTYSVKWGVVGDGVSAGQNPRVSLRAYLP